MKRTIIAIAVVALGLAACTTAEVTHDEEPEHHAEAIVVDVNIYEFGIDYKADPFEEGDEVTFVVTNTGLAPHEFEVTGDEAIEGHLKGGHDGHGDMVMGDKLVLDPGETGELTVTITHDTNIAACLIPGHYEAGMWISLTSEHG